MLLVLLNHHSKKFNMMNKNSYVINYFGIKIIKFFNFWSKLFLKILFATLTSTLLFLACSKQQGSNRMLEELANIYEQALENPNQYLHMNRKMVEWMMAKAQYLPPEKILFHRYLLSQELLRAGQTEDAISELEGILSDIGYKTDRVNNSTRPLIDELALAYLRLGEQINCIEHHASESCIMPIIGDGIQVSKKNTKKAIDLYLVILNKYPDDLGSRWLLNVAYMAIGLYPDSVPKQYLIDGLMGDFQAEIPKFNNVADDLGVAINDISGGLSIEDFNNDGHLDLFVTSYGLNDPSHLFLADGNGRYNNFTSEAGLDGIVSGLNSIHADYNNDGYSDILVLRGAWLADAGSHPNSLLHNNGDGTFTDVTHDSGIISYHPTQTASWADFNLDGHLDLFIGNESNSKWQNIYTKNRVGLGQQHQSELYLNNGDGTFTEVSQEVGIDLEAFVKAAVWGDINNDGLPDLYVSIPGEPNKLYVNKGGTSIKDWSFIEQAKESGVENPLFSFPAWFWDFDNDGWEDLLVLTYDYNHFPFLSSDIASEHLGLPFKSETPRLYKNNKDGTFSDITKLAQLDKALYSMGSNFGDFDNDGWLDFYVGTGSPDLRSIVPNRAFRNVGSKYFEDITYNIGMGHIQKGHSIAFADLDRDGDQDVYAVMGGAVEGDNFANALFENPAKKDENSWITIELVGRTANRSAIGARIEIIIRQIDGQNRKIARTIGTGGSFGSGSLQAEIGLGKAKQIQELSIKWPNAQQTTETYNNLAINKFYHIVEGEPPVVLDREPVPFRKDSKMKHNH